MNANAITWESYIDETNQAEDKLTHITQGTV
jgi:hypothetical protein